MNNVCKKNILIMMNNLPVGGIAKALLSLLAEIDYEHYNVDVGLFEHTGLFMDSLPKQVNLLPPLFIKENIEVKPFSNCKKQFKKGLKNGFRWVHFFVKYSFIRAFTGRENFYYHYCKDQVKNTIDLEKEYDAVVAFASQHVIYYAVDKVKAKKKIGFIHNDYSKSDYRYYKIDKEYFYKLDYLATISDECVKVLKDYFPNLKDKIICIPNIVSCDYIDNLSKEYYPEEMKDKDWKYLVTTCRISINDKGLDLIVECAKYFKDLNKKIKWIIVGGGGEEDKLRDLIALNKVEQYVVITGQKNNPYPYVRNCDLFVQPSRFEGKSISVDEAKLLCKPILITDYSTAKDQIINNENGVICKIDSDEIANNIINLLNDTSLCDKFVSKLKMTKKSNNNEVINIYEKIWSL